jgi:hypothetical protein
VNRIELHARLDELVNRIEDVESAMRILVYEFQKRFPHERLTLYLQRDEKAGRLYGPYWGKLRKIRKGGKRITVKRHLGTRLTRKHMALCGVVGHRDELREYDRRAKLLREAHEIVCGRVGEIRHVLKRGLE